MSFFEKHSVSIFEPFFENPLCYEICMYMCKNQTLMYSIHVWGKKQCGMWQVVSYYQTQDVMTNSEKMRALLFFGNFD